MPSLAHSADIERRMLAPLAALLRDAQALLGVELDADRLEEEAGAASSESSGHPSSPQDSLGAAVQGVARPSVTRLSSPLRYGSVDSAQPEASDPEPGAFRMRPFDRTEPGFASPNADSAMPAEPHGTRFEPASHTASSTPPSGSPGVDATDHRAQDSGTPPLQPGLGIPLSARQAATCEPDEMAPPEHSRTTSREATSTSSTPRPSSATAGRASMRSADPSASPPPYATGPAWFAESLASSSERDAAAVPATGQSHRSDRHPEATTATMPSGNDHQLTAAATTPSAGSPADASRRIGAAPDAHRTLAIPLRPRQAPTPEQSLTPARAANTPMPGSHLQAAARRLASAVEPALEQAYRLTQARCDPSAAAASERTGSPSLVHNTFNVTVALHPGDASASLDSTDLADALTEVLRSSARRHGLEI